MKSIKKINYQQLNEQLIDHKKIDKPTMKFHKIEFLTCLMNEKECHAAVEDFVV